MRRPCPRPPPACPCPASAGARRPSARPAPRSVPAHRPASSASRPHRGPGCGPDRLPPAPCPVLRPLRPGPFPAPGPSLSCRWCSSRLPPMGKSPVHAPRGPRTAIDGGACSSSCEDARMLRGCDGRRRAGVATRRPLRASPPWVTLSQGRTAIGPAVSRRPASGQWVPAADRCGGESHRFQSPRQRVDAPPASGRSAAAPPCAAVSPGASDVRTHNALSSAACQPVPVAGMGADVDPTSTHGGLPGVGRTFAMARKSKPNYMTRVRSVVTGRFVKRGRAKTSRRATVTERFRRSTGRTKR